MLYIYSGCIRYAIALSPHSRSLNSLTMTTAQYYDTCRSRSKTRRFQTTSEPGGRHKHRTCSRFFSPKCGLYALRLGALWEGGQLLVATSSKGPMLATVGDVHSAHLQAVQNRPQTYPRMLSLHEQKLVEVSVSPFHHWTAALQLRQ